MAKIIILYSTTDGHTIKICDRIKQSIESQGDEVTVVAIDDAIDGGLDSFDKIVIGASIRYGKHQPKVFQFIEDNLATLEAIPSAFFTVNVVARKPEKNQPDTNPYLIKFLKQTPWKPDLLGVFAGKINYQMYKFMDRTMIRFIMWITKGPTDPSTNVEFTNWEKVDEFGKTVSSMSPR